MQIKISRITWLKFYISITSFAVYHWQRERHFHRWKSVNVFGLSLLITEHWSTCHFKVITNSFKTNLDTGVVEAAEAVEGVDIWGTGGGIGWVGAADHGFGRGEVFSVPCWGFEDWLDVTPVAKYQEYKLLISMK